jgi:hypothetical protein
MQKILPEVQRTLEHMEMEYANICLQLARRFTEDIKNSSKLRIVVFAKTEFLCELLRDRIADLLKSNLHIQRNGHFSITGSTWDIRFFSNAPRGIDFDYVVTVGIDTNGSLFQNIVLPMAATARSIFVSQDELNEGRTKLLGLKQQ